MGAAALSSTTGEDAQYASAYWEMSRRFEASLEALRTLYHGGSLDPEQVETVEKLFADYDRPL